MKTIKTLTELKQETKNGGKDFKIILNYGLFSTKHIQYDYKGKIYLIFTGVSGTWHKLTNDEMKNDIIYQAIKQNKLIKL